MTEQPTNQPAAMFLKEYNEWKDKFIVLFTKVAPFVYRDNFKTLRAAFYNFLDTVNEATREVYIDITETETAEETEET